MITRFYHILNSKNQVVYVGLTTRTIEKRFLEHKRAKQLNDSFTIKEIDKIEHPKIDSLEIYYREKLKTSLIEQQYIKKELNNGHRLLNLSKGGEWGTQILNKILKEDFFKIYGSYEGYIEYRKQYIKRKNKTKQWIRHWIQNKTKNKTKVWIRNWITHKTTNKTKQWIRNWITNKSINKTKYWIRYWIYDKTKNRTKQWISHWIYHKTKNKTKQWISYWIQNRTRNKTKVWIRNWIYVRKNNS